MTPRLAALVFVLFIVWLFVRDRRLRPMTSWALWLPLVWLGVIGSRPISSWIGGGALYEKPQDYLEGSPLDAGFLLVLIVLGLAVLLRRGLEWRTVYSTNRWVFLFFLYCALSILWSEYSFVSAKRWLKDTGNIVMVLIILTEKDRVAAIRATFARFAYFVIPLSVLFIKYFPNLGRYYDRWTWQPAYCGVTEEKNALGVVVAISCLYLFWDLFATGPRPKNGSSQAGNFPPERIGRENNTSWSQRFDKMRRIARAKAVTRIRDAIELLSRTILILMAVWLLGKADSTNASMCLFLGVCVIVVVWWSMAGRRHLIRNLGSYALLGVALVYLIYSIPGALEALLTALGENITLTGRTDLWADLLKEPINPFFGYGYQSFWLGSGAERLWEKYYYHPNQAHNGYLDTYLNGGFVGLALLVAAIIRGARKLQVGLLSKDKVSVLMFSFLVITLLYSWSEAMFNRISPVWFIFLLSALSYSKSRSAENRNSTRTRLPTSHRPKSVLTSKLPSVTGSTR